MLLIKNIKELIQVREKPVKKLCGKEMKELPVLKNAWLKIEGENIHSFGIMSNIPDITGKEEIIDASGKMVFPCWCDSHTHLVFAGSRENEFVDRINGLTYEQIAAKGGGILNSARKLQNTSEEELLISAQKRLNEVIGNGTGAIEIKSGYGLTTEAELKILRVIKKLKEQNDVIIKSTFLGAHAIPAEYKPQRRKYIDMVINEMLPKVAEEKLADFIDVFCETNYFSPEETDEIINAGAQYGLIPKIHVNQFTAIGGIKIAVKNNALSVDHLEVMTEEDVNLLKNSNTIPTLLPSCSFFLNIPYAPARKLINEGLPVALATDYNPGSTPSGNIPFVLSLACIKMKMTPEEAINAVTINSAYAMKSENETGSITPGKKANVFISKEIPSFAYLPYSFGSNLIDTVIINGKKK
jgi:imidazolonepropionase